MVQWQWSRVGSGSDLCAPEVAALHTVRATGVPHVHHFHQRGKKVMGFKGDEAHIIELLVAELGLKGSSLKMFGKTW